MSEYLFRPRWPDGFRCPRCSTRRAGSCGPAWWSAAVDAVNPR
ncbi:MAG: transposase [Bryobacterales bacterium]|nr:transposase [Bryobacterales bacterium]